MPGTRLSPRVAQPMIGLGLLAAIRDEDIDARVDPDDTNRDGVRGRRNGVPAVGGGTVPGRFGWKANQADLEAQTAAAFLGDIGITSPLHPTNDCPSVQADCAAAAGATEDINAVRLAAVVEVLSKSTEPYDRGDKFENYQSSARESGWRSRRSAARLPSTASI